MKDGHQRVILLDRDGTINFDSGYVRHASDLRILPGAAQAIGLLQDAGYRICVVSNQSGVATGQITRLDLLRVHACFVADLACQGARVDAYAYCPHAANDNCGCRKPRTALAVEIERQLVAPIDYAASWTIGDKPSDVEFGRRLGTRTVLLQSRYWRISEPSSACQLFANSLLEAAHLVLAH